MGLPTRHGEHLEIRCWNSEAGIRIQWYILFKNAITGKITDIHGHGSPTGNRVKNKWYLPLTDGEIIAAQLISDGTTDTRRGRTYGSMHVIKYSDIPNNRYVSRYLLGAGYLSANTRVVGYPHGITEPMSSGYGYHSIGSSANPAAGAEISISVPTNALYAIKGFRAQLVTDATVINRTVTLQVDNSGSGVLFRVDAQAVQPASTTIDYNFVAGYGEGRTSTALNELMVTLPQPIKLPQAYRIRTITNNLQAGDDWGAATYYFEEWIQD